ncbi:MAG: hypothetical protein C5B57_09980 [Blastocatellia bacterium]|nr:MAG: hypothetical protein C5B57_09980 [Blastocatellia bacterium]
MILPAATSAPEWFLEQMPPGYQTRVAEIDRLMSEIRAMDQIGRVLWESGAALAQAAREVFVALKCDAQPGAAPADMTVTIDARRRLLIHVSETDTAIQKKSAELARVFQMLHEIAEDQDRVILVANSDRLTKPVDRAEAMTADAATFLQRMGANFLSAPTLFKLWMVSQQDPKRARTLLERLHSQDGGIFEIS